MTLRKLDKRQMRKLITSTKDALLKTIDVLATEFKIYSWDFLSYEAIVVITCYVYAKSGHLTSDQLQRIRQWFWRSAFGERYKVGGESFVSNDIRTVFDFVVSAKGSASSFGNPPTAKEWMDIGFRSNVSRSRAYILALASKHPRNLTNGAYIDPAMALSSYNKKQFHHVFPRAHLRRIGAETSDNLVINICMIAALGNKEISDFDPNKYLPALAKKLAKDADDVFTSNLLMRPTSFDYASTTYDAFLEARAKIVTDFIETLCGGSVQ